MKLDILKRCKGEVQDIEHHLEEIPSISIEHIQNLRRQIIHALDLIFARNLLSMRKGEFDAWDEIEWELGAQEARAFARNLGITSLHTVTALEEYGRKLVEMRTELGMTISPHTVIEIDDWLPDSSELL